MGRRELVRAANRCTAADASLFVRPRPRPYVRFRRRAGIAETSIWRLHDSDLGSQVGDRRQTRQARGRYRFAGGADRPPHHPDQRADRASARTREGSLLAPRPAQARRAPPPLLDYLQRTNLESYRAPDQGARPAEVGRHRRIGEWKLSERRSALTQLPLSTKSGGIRMSVASGVEDRVGPSSIDYRLSTVPDRRQPGNQLRDRQARQAGRRSVVVARRDDGLATAQGGWRREGADFFPLTVDVEERMYAAGKIPGGFFKRRAAPPSGRS